MVVVITVACPWKSAMNGKFSTRFRCPWAARTKCVIWPTSINIVNLFSWNAARKRDEMLELYEGKPSRILVGTILEIHVHRPRAMGQIRRINRIEVSHSSVSRAHGRRISLCRTGGWSWSGSWRSLGCGRGNDLHTGRGIFLEDRRLQFPPVRIINLALAMIWRLVLLPEGDAPASSHDS